MLKRTLLLRIWVEGVKKPDVKKNAFTSNKRRTATTGESIGISELDDHAGADYYKQLGDTLYILPNQGEITVYCKTVQYIKLAKDSLHMSINIVKQPALDVTAMNNCLVDMIGVELEKFTYKGGKNNRVAGYQMGKLDSIDMQLDKYGSIVFQDVKIKNFILKGDSVWNFTLGDMALRSLEQFKRN